MDDAEILFERVGRLGLVTLNRPKALNALTLPMCAAMLERLAAWAVDPAVRAVLIDAGPCRAFCAGGDIRAVAEWGKTGDPRALAFFATEYRMNAAIKDFPKPYIALLDGIVMGGGLGISVHGSHRVVTENTICAMPETAIGFFPDVGGSYFLSRCPDGLGAYLGLTGARFGPADTLDAGLATHFVPAARLDQIAPRLAAGEDVERVLASVAEPAGPGALAVVRPAIGRCFVAPTIEAVLEVLTAQGEWGRQTAALLATRSPTSLKLVCRQLREGAGRDLDACLRMEYAMAARILEGHDFYEGVRAVVIDKDNNPTWVPDRLDAVSDACIASYFTGEPALTL